jgi:hypothetical protein
MKTAAFFTCRGPGWTGIARRAPGGTPPDFAVYRPLHPTDPMLKLPRAQYEPQYRAILARLSPRQVVEDPRRLADPREPVLLCWERPPFTATVWRHRRMVAEWLERELGLNVPEFQPLPSTPAFPALPRRASRTVDGDSSPPTQAEPLESPACRPKCAPPAIGR